MNLFLAELAQAVAPGAHGIVLMDKAGWHTAGDLVVPENLSLVFLPPYSPELNPIERLWLHLRDNRLSHCVLRTPAKSSTRCCEAWSCCSANRTHSIPVSYVESYRATPEGKKELVGFQTGVRESAQSWRELLIDIKQRGLEIAPDLAVGDGALGFWKAIEEVFPGARHQRCWVHKTANVLNKVALSVQINMKADLREIYGAPTRAAAEAAIDVFADKYGAKYDKAVACLTKDREALLAFFDFPAEHWDHLRTSNPIESVFATVRHRTVRTKGALSAKTAKLMVFKLVNAAAKTWRRLKGENQLPKVVQGVKFQNGIEVIELPAHHAA